MSMILSQEETYISLVPHKVSIFIIKPSLPAYFCNFILRHARENEYHRDVNTTWRIERAFHELSTLR